MTDQPELTKKGTPRKRAPGGGSKPLEGVAKVIRTCRFTAEKWKFLVSRPGGASAYLSRYIDNDPAWQAYQANERPLL